MNEYYELMCFCGGIIFATAFYCLIGKWYDERLKDQRDHADRLRDIMESDRDAFEKECDRASQTAQELRKEVKYWEDEATRLRKALHDAISCFGEKDILVNHERLEAWHESLRPLPHPSAKAEGK